MKPSKQLDISDSLQSTTDKSRNRGDIETLNKQKKQKKNKKKQNSITCIKVIHGKTEWPTKN